MEFLSERLVRVIEGSAEELTNNWLHDVRKKFSTPTYHTYDPDKLYQRAFLVYSQLGKWISRETTKEEIATHYRAMGKERRREGFALSEVIQALIITRRHVWIKILSEGILDTALDMHKAMELNNRVILFFDRTIYFTALGYEK